MTDNVYNDLEQHAASLQQKLHNLDIEKNKLLDELIKVRSEQANNTKKHHPFNGHWISFKLKGCSYPNYAYCYKCLETDNLYIIAGIEYIDNAYCDTFSISYHCGRHNELFLQKSDYDIDVEPKELGDVLNHIKTKASTSLYIYEHPEDKGKIEDIMKAFNFDIAEFYNLENEYE